MTTIKEDYCSRGVYKLLIEKGFDGEIHTTYDKEGYTQPSVSLQMAMKWLREVHHIFIQVELYNKYNDYCFELFQNTHRLILKKYETYNSYEQTCEAAVLYCLKNLI